MKMSYRLVTAGGLIICLVLFLNIFRESTGGTKARTSAIQPAPSPAPIAIASTREKISSERNVTSSPDTSATDQILALLGSSDPRDQSKVYKELLPALIRRDPVAAAAFAQSPAAAQWHDDLMVTVAQVWTDMNVEDAEKWATQLANPTERNMVLGYVCFEEANLNPTRAVQVLDNSEVNSMRREIIVENLAQQWAGQDLSPLYTQVGKLPAGEERDGLYKRIALAQSQSDPQTAVQMIVDRISPGPTQIDAAMYVLRQWAKQDMAAATDWANHFPSGELRDKAAIVLSGNLYGAYQAP
jgi:hypothetical protein